MRQQDDELHKRLNHMPNRDNHEDNRKRRRDSDSELHQNRMEGLKLKIPPFKGKGDSEEYLAWELKIEHLFSSYNHIKEQKVRMTTIESSDYELIWWNKYQKKRWRDEEPMVDTWG